MLVSVDERGCAPTDVLGQRLSLGLPLRLLRWEATGFAAGDRAIVADIESGISGLGDGFA
jgi:hypothetical protein